MWRAGMVFLLSTLANAGGSLVGSTIPPVPSGLQNQLGACVGEDPSYEHACDYSVGILQDDAGVPKIVYGGRLKVQDKSGHHIWLVLDTFDVPTLPKGYQLSYADCGPNGEVDATIVAAVRFDISKDLLDEVLWAKRLDLKAGRFVDLPVRGLKCVNAAFGSD